MRSQIATRSVKLSIPEKFGYALGDAGFNFYWILIGTYLSYFYTDIFGISPAAAGTMFLITKIIDACTDPAMGAIADRTQSRFGKFRPYLLFGALPMAGAAVLTMSTPDLSDSMKLVWAYATYTMMMLCYTILSTPYSSLAGVITADASERNGLFSLRFFCAYSTGIIVGAFTPDLANYFADGNSAKGWQLTMVLYSSIATLLFWVTFITTKERISPSRDQKTKPLEDIKDLMANRPWLILFVLAMVIMMTIVFRGSSATYYFKYFLERPDLMGAYIGLQMAAYALGCLATPYLTKIIKDKAKLLMLLMALVGILSVLLSWVTKPEATGVVTLKPGQTYTLVAQDLMTANIDDNASIEWREHVRQYWILNRAETVASGPTLVVDGQGQVLSVVVTQADGLIINSSDFPWQIKLIFLLNILISLALGPKSPLTWSMYADAADYNEWRTGRRATAMTFAAATFSQKLGGALGSAFILWVLALVGYQANQIQQGASVNSIVWLQTIVPAGFAFLSLWALKYYQLDNAKLVQIQKDLQLRSH